MRRFMKTAVFCALLCGLLVGQNTVPAFAAENGVTLMLTNKENRYVEVLECVLEETAEENSSSALLAVVLRTLNTAEPMVRLAMTKYLPDVEMNLVNGDHNGWGCLNDFQYADSLSNFTYEPVSAYEVSEGWQISVIPASEEDWSLLWLGRFRYSGAEMVW